jgi:hypothetical protein
MAAFNGHQSGPFEVRTGLDRIACTVGPTPGCAQQPVDGMT